MGRKQKRSRARQAARAPSRHEPIHAMDAPPETPQERSQAVNNLTISAPPSSPGLEEYGLRFPPPSPASLPSCPRDTSASTAAHQVSPAWESMVDAAGASISSVPATQTAEDPSTGPNPAAQSSVGTAVEPPDADDTPKQGDMMFSAANLRLDMIPPVPEPRIPLLARAVAAAAFAPAPGPSPSAPPGINIEGSAHRSAPPRRTASAFFDLNRTHDSDEEAAASPMMQGGEEPTSSHSRVSGIFELEIDSPLQSAGGGPAAPPAVAPAASAAAATVVGDGGQDIDDNAHEPEESVEAAPGEFTAAAAAPTGSIGRAHSPGSYASREIQGVWGRIAPSPSVAGGRPLQGAWGRLQEVMDEIKDLSPQRRDTELPSPPTHSPAPLVSSSSTPPAEEERKGFGPARDSRSASTNAASSGGASRFRTPSPYTPHPAAPVTSPPTPAASAGNTPADTPLQRSTLPVMSPPLDEEEAPGDSVGEPAAVIGGASPIAATSVESQAVPPPPPPPPGGAMGAAFSLLDEMSGGGGGEGWVGGAGGSLGGELHHASLGVGDAEDQEADVASDRGGYGGRGFVGQGFVRAAEALSESPHLRRAAGAAATVVSAAADTAKVQFTITSKTIGKVLVASAKSFEDFVAEQLREDGWGQVLRTEGSKGLLVPRGKTLTQVFLVAPGCYLCWEFRVQDHDLGFSLRRRTQGMGGSTEEDIFGLERYPSGETFQGRWTAEGSATAVVVMVWDNSYSLLRPKTLAYNAQVLKPGVDPSAPPPPPPPTPADDHGLQLPGRGFGGGGRGGGGYGRGEGSPAADTEGFAIEDYEGEGEEAYHPAIGEGEGEEGRVEGVCAAAGTSSPVGGARAGAAGRWQVSGHSFDKGEEAAGGGGGGRGGGEGIGAVPETIKIEDFLAMPEGGGTEDDGDS